LGTDWGWPIYWGFLEQIGGIIGVKASQPPLSELWDKYTEFKRPGLSPSILAKDYGKVSRCINVHLPTRSLDGSIAIRDWLVANQTPNAVKRYLTQLSACCDWATKSQMISHNPFKAHLF
jgi:integrase